MKARFALALVAAVSAFVGTALAEETPKVVTPEVAVVATVDPVDPEAAISTADPADLTDACELNYTPADGEDDGLTMSAKPPCKNCSQNPTCACRYNGLPRVSCNPCCWGNLGIPQICSS